MVVFNQSLYDLNHKRGYCVDGTDGFPVDTISDMKISVPNDTEQIIVRGLYLKEEILRLTLTAISKTSKTSKISQDSEKPVALFTSDLRSSLRIGEPYMLRSVDPAYGGLVVFGPGIRKDFTENLSFPVSEECLTRYRPSGIPCAGQTCDNVRLTGEVRLLGGDPSRVVTEGVDIPDAATTSIIASRGLRIRLLDNGIVDASNPMIEMANGINSYIGLDGSRSPIYQLFGALPNHDGEVRVVFDEHFHFAGVVQDWDDPEPVLSQLAVGTDLTMDDVCASMTTREPGESEEPCSPKDIRFELVNCQEEVS